MAIFFSKTDALKYWFFQIIFWIIYVLFLFSITLFFVEKEYLNLSVLITRLALIFLVSILLTHVLILYIKRKDLMYSKISSLIFRVLIGIFIISILIQTFSHFIIGFIFSSAKSQDISWLDFIFYAFSYFIILIIWSVIYISTQLIEIRRKNKIKRLELQSQLHEAELIILKNQINPHFLFNALNNIRSLILSDKNKAREMITHISDLLRYSIQFNTSDKVSLLQEIEVVKDYLQLESIQYNERLSYTFHVNDDTLQIMIPPMSIQVLVENAIKHGISVEKNGGEILIESFINGNFLYIKVTNNGMLVNQNKREGIGIKNVMKRMKLLFGSFAEFKLENTSENTITASLKIPIV